jgi:hypothetical protein
LIYGYVFGLVILFMGLVQGAVSYLIVGAFYVCNVEIETAEIFHPLLQIVDQSPEVENLKGGQSKRKLER